MEILKETKIDLMGRDVKRGILSCFILATVFPFMLVGLLIGWPILLISNLPYYMKEYEPFILIPLILGNAYSLSILVVMLLFGGA